MKKESLTPPFANTVTVDVMGTVIVLSFGNQWDKDAPCDYFTSVAIDLNSTKWLYETLGKILTPQS